MLFLFLSLILFPIGVFVIARMKRSNHSYFYTGLALGFVAPPYCMGLYGLYYMGIDKPYFMSQIVFWVAMAGYVLMIAHGYPGAFIMKVINAENWTGSFALNHILYWSVNSFIWMLFYGLIGRYIDKKRLQTI
jgi:hypothetical protein